MKSFLNDGNVSGERFVLNAKVEIPNQNRNQIMEATKICTFIQTDI